MARRQIDRLHVDRVHAVEVGLRNLQHGLPGHRGSGVVDQHPQSAEAGQRPRHQPLHLGVRGDVRLVEHGGAAGGGDLSRDPLAAAGVEVVDHHLGAGGGEALGDALAEPRAGAGHDRHLVIKPHDLLPPWWFGAGPETPVPPSCRRTVTGER